MALNRGRVISAIYQLAERNGGQWPSIAELSTFLEEQPSVIGEHLKELKRLKLFRDRQRGNKRVWMPWEQS